MLFLSSDYWKKLIILPHNINSNKLILSKIYTNILDYILLTYGTSLPYVILNYFASYLYVYIFTPWIQ